ncbi:MAG: RNA methyltransferase [Ferruginibacter sp.]
MQLPETFLRSLNGLPGFDEAEFMEAHENSIAPTSIRINPAKIKDEELVFQNISANHVPWSSYGYYLSERPSFTLDPLFHAGAYYVQEASSMFLEQALKQSVDLNKPIKVLDLCAAPGGKSTLIQSLISKESLLVSNELIKQRVNILTENIIKWSAENVLVTNNNAKDFQRLQNFFDVIIVDAPCSGSGLFRKDPKAIEEWSLQNVLVCSQRQQQILKDVLPALKPAGVLIYSTCSYAEAEDEAIADFLIESENIESLQLKIESNWDIIESRSAKHQSFGYRFYPDKIKGEGFFISVFKNKEEEEQEVYFRAKKKLPAILKKEMDVLQNMAEVTENDFLFKWNERIFITNKMASEVLPLLLKNLYIKNAGIELGEVIRNDFIPAHALAVSFYVSPLVRKIECEKEFVLEYLRRRTINIPGEDQGWALITYKKIGIGWIKVLKNRVNNYYPNGWRILNS